MGPAPLGREEYGEGEKTASTLGRRPAVKPHWKPNCLHEVIKGNTPCTGDGKRFFCSLWVMVGFWALVLEQLQPGHGYEG